MLRLAYEPRRHARRAHAHADASRSGIHTGSEKCAMSAWSHSEWRLLHAYVPAYSRPARAPLSGKRNFKTRDEGTEAASLVHGACCGVVAPDSPMGARYYPAGAVRIAMTKCDVLLSLSRPHERRTIRPNPRSPPCRVTQNKREIAASFWRKRSSRGRRRWRTNITRRRWWWR